VKAAVCREFGKPLSIEEVTLAPPQAGEVKVRVSACGICQSDVHSIAGAWGGTLPAVYGHEVAGVIDAVGPGVDDLRAGQPVVVSLIRSCRHCAFCARGEPVFCETTFRLDRESPLTAKNGAAITQGMHTGGFAESVVVDASQAVGIPDDIPFDAAALLACAVITGFGAVVNTAGVAPGSSVVVIGTGGVGLNAVQAAAICGARPVIAVDLSNQKLDAARRFGATHTVNPRKESLDAAIAALTRGRRADTVIVTAGSTKAVEQGVTLARRGGTVVLVGMPPSGVATIDPGQIAHDGQRILGSKVGSARPQIDIPRLVSLYRDGRLKLDELVSHRYPLRDINAAIAAAGRDDVLRNVIVFES
jgi:S-(hydroxymethyl)glutathione dehydrogenase/alcohol dehydrogenase